MPVKITWSWIEGHQKDLLAAGSKQISRQVQHQLQQGQFPYLIGPIRPFRSLIGSLL